MSKHNPAKTIFYNEFFIWTIQRKRRENKAIYGTICKEGYMWVRKSSDLILREREREREKEKEREGEDFERLIDREKDREIEKWDFEREKNGKKECERETERERERGREYIAIIEIGRMGRVTKKNWNKQWDRDDDERVGFKEERAIEKMKLADWVERKIEGKE